MEVPTTAMGSMTLAVDYDVLNSPPASKPQLAALKFARRCAVWDDCRYECRPEDLKRYGKARPTTIPDESDSDARLTYLGNVWLASQDLWIPSYPAPTIPGEFWTHYTILLSTPKPPSISGDAISYSLTGICTASDNIFSRTNTTSLKEWKGVYSNIELDIDDTSYIVIFNQSGYYQLDWWAGSVTSEIESDEVSLLYTVGTSKSRTMRISEFEASQCPTQCVAYLNPADSALDDSLWAGSENWMVYIPPSSTPFRMSMTSVARAMDAPEITGYRLVVSPGGPRAYPVPNPQTGIMADWPYISPASNSYPFPPLSGLAALTKGRYTDHICAVKPLALASSSDVKIKKRKERK
jgi:hypothetical protein